MNGPGRFISRRVAEVGMALAGAAFGGIVVVGALRHDVGWGLTGPGAGYFPMRIGLLLMGVATLLMLRQSLPPLTATLPPLQREQVEAAASDELARILLQGRPSEV